MPFPDFFTSCVFYQKTIFLQKLQELIGLGIFIPTDYDTGHSDIYNQGFNLTT